MYDTLQREILYFKSSITLVCFGYIDRGKLQLEQHPFDPSRKSLLPKWEEFSKCKTDNEMMKCFRAGNLKYSCTATEYFNIFLSTTKLNLDDDICR